MSSKYRGKSRIDRLKEREGSAQIHKKLTDLLGLVGPKESRVKDSSDYGLYYDPKGKLTTGYGHLVKDLEEAAKLRNLDENQASELLKEDVQSHTDDSRKLLKKYGIEEESLSQDQKDAIADMVFQLGLPSTSKFKSTFPAIKEGEFDKVRDFSEKWKWKKDSPKRVEDFINRIPVTKDIQAKREYLFGLPEEDRDYLNKEEPIDPTWRKLIQKKADGGVVKKYKDGGVLEPEPTEAPLQRNPVHDLMRRHKASGEPLPDEFKYREYITPEQEKQLKDLIMPNVSKKATFDLPQSLPEEKSPFDELIKPNPEAFEKPKTDEQILDDLVKELKLKKPKQAFWRGGLAGEYSPDFEEEDKERELINEIASSESAPFEKSDDIVSDYIERKKEEVAKVATPEKIDEPERKPSSDEKPKLDVRSKYEQLLAELEKPKKQEEYGGPSVGATIADSLAALSNLYNYAQGDKQLFKPSAMDSERARFDAQQKAKKTDSSVKQRADILKQLEGLKKGGMTEYQRKSLGLREREVEAKEKKAGKKDEKELSPFSKELTKHQAKEFSKSLEDRKKTAASLDLVDRTLEQFMNYSINKIGGTGPIVTLGGLTKYNPFGSSTEELDAAFKEIDIKNMVSTFSGMSKAVDSDAERAAWRATQPSVSKDDKPNMQILLGMKSSLMKDREIAEAKQRWVEKNGTIEGFTHPILEGKVTTMVSRDGVMELVPKDAVDQFKELGLMPLDEYVDFGLSGVKGSPNQSKKVVKNLYSEKTDKTKLIFDDGTEAIIKGRY